MKTEADFRGLTEKEAELSRERYGSNELSELRRAGFAGKLLDSFGDPIIKILLCALAVTVLVPGAGSVFESLGIAVAIIVSTFVSAVSEYGSEKTFAKMQEQAKEKSVRVIRDGAEKTIRIGEVVKGDHVVISAGEGIPADGFLCFGTLSVDLSSLNGESAEQVKTSSEEMPQKPALSDECSLFRGATVTAGKGIMLVTDVGDSTYYGNMAREVQTEKGTSPLGEKLSVLARTLSRFGYFCALCVAGVSLFSSFVLNESFVFSFSSVTKALLHALTLAVSVVVVAVPEGLPMMITVVLSSNMLRMQKQNVQVRKPVGIETAGSMNILFTDKTGTLTYGTPKTSGYLTGDIESAGRASDLSESHRFLLGVGALFAGGCSVESPLIPSKRRASGGDGTDRAVLDGYFTCGEYPKGVTLLSRLPFDSKRKLTAASVSLDGNPAFEKKFGTYLTVIKGAPEILLDKCAGYYKKDGSVAKADREKLKAKLREAMSGGMRVVALVTSGATAEAVENMAKNASQNAEVDTAPLFAEMNFVMFLLIRDEIRREAPEAIRTLKEAGIQTVMITGDSKETAEAIAIEAGMIEKGEPSAGIYESKDIASMTDAELSEALPEMRVVARALPGDKSRLVRAAKAKGLVAAMTGDGINDAPALKQADVGFAMGSGTEVAKEAGDIIITDNNIASITRAVLYGRTIFRSIRKFIVFQLTMNLCAVGVSIVGPFIGCESPVTVIQMLWINMIMDTLAALAFAGEAPMKRYMKEAPIPKNAPVLDGEMAARIFSLGLFTVMLCLWYYESPFIGKIFPETSGAFMCGFFTLFVFSGIWGAFSARTTRLNIFSGLLENPAFVMVISAVFTVQTVLIYYGGSVFRCVPLSFSQIVLLLLISFSVIPVGRMIEVLLRLMKRSPSRKENVKFSERTVA